MTDTSVELQITRLVLSSVNRTGWMPKEITLSADVMQRLKAENAAMLRFRNDDAEFWVGGKCVPLVEDSKAPPGWIYVWESHPSRARA